MFGGRGLCEIQKYLKVLFIIFCEMQVDHSTRLQVDMANQSDQIYNQIEARKERSNCDTNKRKKDFKSSLGADISTIMLLIH
jgi:hypothetical protein